MELKLALAASGTSRARPGRCHLPGGVEGGWVRMCDGGCSVRHEGGTREWGGTAGRNERALFQQRTKRTARFALPNESAKMAALPAVRLARSV